MKLSRRFILFWTVVLVFFVFSAQSISDAHANSAPSQQFGYKQINLHPDDVAAFDRFGYSVDISSTFAVIGSPSHDVWDGTNLYTSAGAAYVYQRIDGIWELSTKLTAPDPQAYANFGISVSIDKNTVAIGAVGYDSSETIDIGAIYISSYADGTWQPLQRLESGGDEESENFGSALHLEGRILVVGASTSDQSGLIDSGAAYVFIGSSGNWFKQAMLTAGIPQTNSGFGHSVYTDGTRIIVGSPQEDNSGRAYIYKKE